MFTASGRTPRRSRPPAVGKAWQRKEEAGIEARGGGRLRSKVDRKRQRVTDVIVLALLKPARYRVPPHTLSPSRAPFEAEIRRDSDRKNSW